MLENHTLPATPAELEKYLADTLLAHRPRLRKLWRAAQDIQRRNAQNAAENLATLERKFTTLFEESVNLLESKRQNRTVLEFPENLPVSARREEIARTILENQVVILAGETGSGKTTQLPKICLEIGRGIYGLIGHTQPRRIAASTVASRIAEELRVPLGTSVGFQVRFTDQTQPGSHIKLMTDGILLAEIQHDPLLLRYDTLIIDEAHERSLNIDFLLGYLSQILPKRPDLKLIVTSATIDVQRFSRHFNNAPILEVSGRTYPVEILYRPWGGELEDQSQAIIEAIEEILTLPHSGHGDILVFLAGERDIRETALAIRKAEFPHLEVLPLYARLSLAEQNRVFQGHKGRRVVLATNVAETSITVPGIGYVIDPGYARVSRYSVRTKVQRLPIEPISQASANQRAGRCGRVSNGVCIRLYAEEDFLQRAEFTDAEILRTNLASVVLQMLYLGIGDIRRFPFVEPPDSKYISDGYRLLEELQAVTAKGQLTPIGKQLASLPLDPRLARMVLEGQKQGALREVLIIVAALTIQDPRERPAEKQQAADEKHRRFWDDNSDFLAYLNLWNYAEQQRQDLSQNQWRKQSAREFLSHLRLREWRELHHQIRLACKPLGLKENQEPATYPALHKALLAGLLGNIGTKNEEPGELQYLGARNRKFSIFPGSSQFKKKPRWLMAAEVLETSKLYAHGVAKVEPEWILELGQHLLKHHYYEPHYNAKSGQVVAYDRITLFGLMLADKKTVNYSHINSVEARTVFIRSALVEAGYGLHPSRQERGKKNSTKEDFFIYNQRQVADVQDLEAKSRRKDILVDDEVIYRFYEERIPAQVVNFAGFEHWRKEAEKTQPDLLWIPRDLLMQHGAEGITEAQFPATMTIEGMILPLTYHFEPGHADDGVSIGVPASVLHTLPEARLEWLVPGFLRDKCITLIKSLPKQWRKQFVPVPHYVDQIMPRLKPGNQPLLPSLQHELERLLGKPLPKDFWDGVELDPFYRMNIHVLDERGKILDRGRDLHTLRERYRGHVQTTLQKVGENIERDAVTQWDFGVLETSRTLKRGAVQVRAFPALVVEQQTVALRLLDNPLEAEQESVRGVVALLMMQLSTSVKYLQKDLLKNKDMALSIMSLGRRDEVVQDLIRGAVYRACLEGFALPRDADAFAAALSRGKNTLVQFANEYENLLLQILDSVVQIRKKMKTTANQLMLAATFADIKQQLECLIFKGFMSDVPWDWLEQYPRYLKAIMVRLEKAPMDIQKDKSATRQLHLYWEKHSARLHKDGEAAYRQHAAWRHFRWMLEEFRVSLFAQTLKTRAPVSEKRLDKLWEDSQQP
jgi:ATP-dependent helicase HrpA